MSSKTNPKKEVLKQCAKIMSSPIVARWYKENMEGQPQANTIETLTTGVASKALRIEEALSIALIIGVQWNVKFEGVP